MSTNHTISVINNSQIFCKYGHYDGYPSYMGTSLLKWLKLVDIQKFSKNLSFLKLTNYPLPIDGECMNDSTSDEDNSFDSLSALEAIHKIVELDSTVSFTSDYPFNAFSSACEWAYCIDLDTQTFEVYKGHNILKLQEGERFFNLNTLSTLRGSGEKINYPVKLFAKYSLHNLPTDKKFLEDIDYLGNLLSFTPNHWLPNFAIDFTKNDPVKIFADLFSFSPDHVGFLQNLSELHILSGKNSVLTFRDKNTNATLKVETAPSEKYPKDRHRPYVYRNVKLMSFTSDLLPNEDIFDLAKAYNMDTELLEKFITLRLNY